MIKGSHLEQLAPVPAPHPRAQPGESEAIPSASAGFRSLYGLRPDQSERIRSSTLFSKAVDHSPRVQAQTLQAMLAKASNTSRRQGISTGLPMSLKVGLEHLSGLELSTVRVHYHSQKPATLDALACTQGQTIEIGPGQEDHLPHEAWHVVQQMQGRVKATTHKEGTPINDDKGLEREADLMGAKAWQLGHQSNGLPLTQPLRATSFSEMPPVQRKTQIGRTNYDGKDMQRQFLGDVQRIMQRHRYPAPVKLLIACAEALQGKGVLHNVVVATEAEFVDKVAALGLAAPAIHGRGVLESPETLGKRPQFAAEIAELRRESGEEASASRHVIPSHLLGFAAENAPGTNEELEAWIEAYGEKADLESGASQRTLRRTVWHILHNHKGNLWAGPSIENSAVGFVSGTIQSWIRRMLRAADPQAELVTISGESVPSSDEGLAGKMTEIKNAVLVVFQEILEDLGALNPPGWPIDAGQLKAELYEVWEQIEGDVRSFDLSEYTNAHQLLQELRENPSLALLAQFMETTFRGTYNT